MPRIVTTFISLALVGQIGGTEVDDCFLGDEDCTTLLQVTGSLRTSSEIAADAMPRSVVRGTLVSDQNSLHRIGWRIPDERTETGNMEVDHANTADLYNWKPNPESDGQQKAQQARDGAAENVQFAEQAAREAQRQAKEKTPQAEQSQAHPRVKDLQVKAAKAMKNAEGRAESASKVASATAKSRDVSASDFQDLSDATTATVVAAEKAKAAADAAAAAVASEAHVSTSGEEVPEATVTAAAKPPKRKAIERVDWEKDYLVNDNNPLEPGAWNTTKMPPSATAAASSEAHTSTSGVAIVTTSALPVEAIGTIAITSSTSITSTTTATITTTTTQKRVVRGTLVSDHKSLHRIGWRIPDERTETGNMEVDHANTADLYNWKPYPESDGQQHQN